MRQQREKRYSNQEMSNWKNLKLLGILSSGHLHSWKKCIQACTRAPACDSYHACLHCIKSQRCSRYSSTHHLPLYSWSLLLWWHIYFASSPSSEILPLNTIYCSLAPRWHIQNIVFPVDSLSEVMVHTLWRNSSCREQELLFFLKIQYKYQNFHVSSTPAI